MCVNNLPKVATQWNSGATRDSNRGRRVVIPSALTTIHHRACSNSYTLLKGPHFRMANNLQNSGFVANFLTKFALLDERKMPFWRQNPLEPNDNLLASNPWRVETPHCDLSSIIPLRNDRAPVQPVRIGVTWGT